MSRDLFKMNMIASVQKLNDEDIEIIQEYIKTIEEENERLHSIIKELREELRKYENDGEANRYAPISECLEILDKEHNDNKR